MCKIIEPFGIDERFFSSTFFLIEFLFTTQLTLAPCSGFVYYFIEFSDFSCKFMLLKIFQFCRKEKLKPIFKCLTEKSFSILFRFVFLCEILNNFLIQIESKWKRRRSRRRRWKKHQFTLHLTLNLWFLKQLIYQLLISFSMPPTLCHCLPYPNTFIGFLVNRVCTYVWMCVCVCLRIKARKGNDW